MTLPWSTILLFLHLTAVSLWADEGRQLRVHFIAVGYGDAVLIEFPDHTAMLVDAGPRESSVALKKYLKEKGIHTIHSAVISHPHENHFGGFFDLLEEFSIAQVWTNGQKEGEGDYAVLLERFNARHIPVGFLEEGAFLKQGSPIQIKVLNPSFEHASFNDQSVVLWLIYGQTAFLLTGDIEVKRQQEIFSKYPDVLTSQVIQIPHHGRSLSAHFRHVSPETSFIISTGPNVWGMPDDEALAGCSGKVFRTDRQGTIVLESNGQRVRVIWGDIGKDL